MTKEEIVGFENQRIQLMELDGTTLSGTLMKANGSYLEVLDDKGVINTIPYDRIFSVELAW
jgi:hypothetical protein